MMQQIEKRGPDFMRQLVHLCWFSHTCLLHWCGLMEYNVKCFSSLTFCILYVARFAKGGLTYASDVATLKRYNFTCK